MTTNEGFARRWARLKRAVPVPAAEPAKAPAVAPEEEPPVLEGLKPEEIAGWLKRDVPQAWKTAALRRLWVADPAIRGFVGLADYAWDWNAPGGAAMLGPMGALDDMANLLMRAMGTEPAAVVADAPEEKVAEAAPIAVAEVVAEAPAPRAIADGRRRGGRAAPV